VGLEVLPPLADRVPPVPRFPPAPDAPPRALAPPLVSLLPQATNVIEIALRTAKNWAPTLIRLRVRMGLRDCVICGAVLKDSLDPFPNHRSYRTETVTVYAKPVPSAGLPLVQGEAP